MFVYFSLLVLVICWLFLLFLLPILKLTVDNSIIDLCYRIFSLICHQNPERSYYFMGEKLPVCVRCLGLYFGLLLGLVIYPFFSNIRETRIPNVKISLIFLAPIVFDGVSQMIGLYNSPHYVRILTGILASSGSMLYILPILNNIFFKLKGNL